MKSAYELAMSRLETANPAKKLSEEQKERLREIDSEYDAKVAERRIFLEGEIAKEGDSQEADSLRRQLASELSSLQEKRDSRKEAVRNS